MKLITKFEFDSAHRLVGYEGKCQALHGHRWVVELEIEGNCVDKIGMLWDFTNVRMLEHLFDHKTILKACMENKQLIEAIIDTCGSDSIYLMQTNPTAENLSREILGKLKKRNPGLRFKVKVFESPKSSCEASI